MWFFTCIDAPHADMNWWPLPFPWCHQSWKGPLVERGALLTFIWPNSSGGMRPLMASHYKALLLTIIVNHENRARWICDASTTFRAASQDEGKVFRSFTNGVIIDVNVITHHGALLSWSKCDLELLRAEVSRQSCARTCTMWREQLWLITSTCIWLEHLSDSWSC